MRLACAGTQLSRTGRFSLIGNHAIRHCLSFHLASGERVNRHGMMARTGIAIALALAIAGLAAIAMPAHASSPQHQLACPSIAPASWNLRADARLVRSAVLGARTG